MNPNDLFPAGIDPLEDLIQMRSDLNELRTAVIQMQMNQNELIRATSDTIQKQQRHVEQIAWLARQLKTLNATIKSQGTSSGS